MGNFSQHATTALAVIVLTTFSIHFSASWWFHVAAFLLGNLLPDIDHVQSRIHRYLLVPRLFARRFVHWGHCHSIAGAAILITPLLAIELAAFWMAGWIPLSAASMFAGEIVHLLTDEACKSKKNKRKALKWW